MSALHSNRVRLGILALPLAGLLFVVGPLLRGLFIDATVNPQGFAQAAAAPGFATAWLVILLSQVVALLGFVALYGALVATASEGMAFWGMVTSIVGGALFLSLTGSLAFAAPVAARLYEQGQTSAMQIIAAAFFDGPVAAVLYPSGLLATVGAILFGIAIWRSGALPRPAGVLFALALPLSAFAPAFSFPLEMAGNIFFLISGAWIAWSVWQRETAARTRTSPLQA